MRVVDDFVKILTYLNIFKLKNEKNPGIRYYGNKIRSSFNQQLLEVVLQKSRQRRFVSFYK